MAAADVESPSSRTFLQNSDRATKKFETKIEGESSILKMGFCLEEMVQVVSTAMLDFLRLERHGANLNDPLWSASSNEKYLLQQSVGSYGAYLADGSEYSGDYGDAMDLEFLKNFHRIAFETVSNELEAQVFDTLLEEEEINIPSWMSFNSKDGINVVS